MGKGILTFINEEFLQGDASVTSALFSAGKVFATGQNIKEIFSDETCSKISLIPQGERRHFMVALRFGEMLDAVVSKFLADEGFEVVTVSFQSLPVSFNAVKTNEKTTQFGVLANQHLKNAFMIISSIENKSHKLQLELLKKEIFMGITTIVNVFKFVKDNNIKNSSLNFVCMNVWFLISELYERIMSIPNTEIVNRFCSCYNVYINVENVKAVIMRLVHHLSSSGRRTYIKCEYDDTSARIIISDFKDLNPEKRLGTVTDIDEISFDTDIYATVICSGADFNATYYDDGSVEYKLIFAKNNRSKVCYE